MAAEPPATIPMILKCQSAFGRGQRVRLSNGSEAKITRIEGDGFGKPVLMDVRGGARGTLMGEISR